MGLGFDLGVDLFYPSFFVDEEGGAKDAFIFFPHEFFRPHAPKASTTVPDSSLRRG